MDIRQLSRAMVLLCLIGFSALEAKEPNYYAEGLRAEYAGNYTDAVEKHKIAAGQGLKDAKYALGRIYRDIYAEEQASFDWFSEAAAQGEGFSQLELGKLYVTGNTVVAQNLAKARHWLTKALQHSVAGQAAFHLYEIESDIAKKFQWLTQAAESGVTEAMSIMSQVYSLGLLGQPVNQSESEQWAEEVTRSLEQ